MVLRAILLILLLAIPSWATNKSRGEIKSEAKQILAKDGYDASFYADSIFNTFVQASIEDISTFGEGVIKADTIVTVAEQFTYSLNSDFIKPKSLHRFPTRVVLTRINSEDAGQIAITTPTTGFTSTQYFTEGQYLTLLVKPALDGDSLLLWYYAMGKELTADTMTTDILLSYQSCLFLFTAAYTIARDDDTRAAFYWQWGLQKLNLKRASLGLPPVDVIMNLRVINPQ